MRAIKLFFILCILQILIPQKAHAYLDPGTGSMVIQIVIASLAGIGCTFSIWKDKVINFFKKGSKDE